MRGLVPMVVALAVAGCGGGQGKSRAPGPRSAATIHQERAAEGARVVVKQLTSDLRRGYTDGLQTLLSPDAVVIGPDGALLAGRTAAVLALTKVFPRRKHKLRSRGLSVVSSPGARAAWAADLVEVDGVVFRVALVLVDDDGLWSIVAVQLLADTPLGAPSSVPEQIGPGAEAVAALFRDAAASPPRLLEDLAESSEVRVLAGKRDDARGYRGVKKLWKKRLGATKLELAGGVQARLTPDGTLGWVAAGVRVGGDGGTATHERCFLIYERVGGAWRLMAALGPLVARR